MKAGKTHCFPFIGWSEHFIPNFRKNYIGFTAGVDDGMDGERQGLHLFVSGSHDQAGVLQFSPSSERRQLAIGTGLVTLPFSLHLFITRILKMKMETLPVPCMARG